MFEGATVSLDLDVLVAMLGCAAGLGAVAGHAIRRCVGIWRARAERRSGNAAIQTMLRKDALGAMAQGFDRPAAAPDPRGTPHGETLLDARIDYLREIGQFWGAPVRASALDQVTRIMRQSVRARGREAGTAGDVLTEIPGEGFTILVRGGGGAQGRDTGTSIAQRLRRELARARIDGLADNLRVTTSFGIAHRWAGESDAAWRARAAAALAEAQARGGDTIIEASVAEEVKLLPPPTSAAH